MLTSQDLAASLDQVVMRHWNDAVTQVEGTGRSMTDQLAALTIIRKHLLAWREQARLQGIGFIRSKGAAVPDDFGLPGRALTLAPRTACAGEA